MKFSIYKSSANPILDYFINGLVSEFRRNGYQEVSSSSDLNFVLNVTDYKEPKSYRRKHQQEFVVTAVLLDRQVENIKNTCFVTLVKTLSNMVLGFLPEEDNYKQAGVYYITPEAGFVRIGYNPAKIHKCLIPVINSRFVLRNQVKVGLPPSSQIDSPELNDLVKYARLLGDLGHLPAPFPLEKYLDKNLVRQLFRLYEMKGLSYGNLSVRSTFPGFNGQSFWMTARGADKVHLQKAGHDILLVTGFDTDSGEMKVVVPPDYDPSVRVSVDAIEHYLIYSAFPKVGAIVHIHAWIEGITCTSQNFPCGTYELAGSVVQILKNEPFPEQTAVGLKNHGITVTGPGLKEIFNRIKGKVRTEVPMYE